MSASKPISHAWSSGWPVSAAFLMGAIARRLEPASAAINAMTIALRIQPVRCMACELPCASMLRFTLLDTLRAARGSAGAIILAQLDTTKSEHSAIRRLVRGAGRCLGVESYRASGSSERGRMRHPPLASPLLRGNTRRVHENLWHYLVRSRRRDGGCHHLTRRALLLVTRDHLSGTTWRTGLGISATATSRGRHRES